jgi:hypothetical protein
MTSTRRHRRSEPPNCAHVRAGGAGRCRRSVTPQVDEHRHAVGDVCRPSTHAGVLSGPRFRWPHNGGDATGSSPHGDVRRADGDGRLRRHEGRLRGATHRLASPPGVLPPVDTAEAHAYRVVRSSDPSGTDPSGTEDDAAVRPLAGCAHPNGRRCAGGHARPDDVRAARVDRALARDGNGGDRTAAA